MNLKSFSIIVLVIVLFGSIWYAYRYKQSSQVPTSSSVLELPEATSDSVPVVTPVVNGGAVVASEITLTISSPTNGATVTSANVTVRGKTMPGAEVFVNDETALADESGNFSVTLTLDEGENPIVISVNDAEGNVAEKELMVNYDSGE